MTKKIVALADYIPAREAAQLLSQKLGRPINPVYIHRLKNVRCHRINATTKLYHRGDIISATIRRRQAGREVS